MQEFIAPEAYLYYVAAWAEKGPITRRPHAAARAGRELLDIGGCVVNPVRCRSS